MQNVTIFVHQIIHASGYGTQGVGAGRGHEKKKAERGQSYQSWRIVCRLGSDSGPANAKAVCPSLVEHIR